MFRSDALLPEVPHPLHETPSAHRPFVDSHPDSAEFDSLSGDNSDGGVALAEYVKGKAVGAIALRPKLALAVPKNRGQLCGKRRVSGDAR